MVMIPRVCRTFCLSILHLTPLCTDVDTEEGARLLRLVEFNTHAEVRSMITIAKRDPGFSGPAEESKFVLCFGNGAVFTLSPVEEACFRRLHLLQGQLTRNVQHIAGLNPKMFRYAFVVSPPLR